MKIALIATDSWYLWNFRKETITALIEQGHDVTCICDKPMYEAQIAGLGAHVIQARFGKRRISLFDIVRGYRELRTVLRDGAYDAVFSFNPKTNFLTGLVRRSLGFRWFPTVSGMGALSHYRGMRRGAIDRVFSAVFRNAQQVFFQNGAVLEHWLKQGYIAPDRAKRVYGSGVDLAQFGFSEPPDGPLSIVYIGRMLEAKGIRHVLDLAGACKKRGLDIAFHLAGQLIATQEGGVSPAILLTAQTKGLITYHGPVTDVRPFISGRTVGCLLSSYGEGLPRSLLEFLATGRPILMSNFEGAADLSHHGRLVDVSAADWIDDALEFLAGLSRDPAAYDQLCKANRKSAEQHFGLALNLEIYLQALEQTP